MEETHPVQTNIAIFTTTDCRSARDCLGHHVPVDANDVAKPEKARPKAQSCQVNESTPFGLGEAFQDIKSSERSFGAFGVGFLKDCKPKKLHGRL